MLQTTPQICAGLVCGPGSDNWQDIQDPFQGGEPLVPDDQLNIEQIFSSLDGNPPATGACCDPDSPEFVLEDPNVDPPVLGSVKATAYNDCAARSCLEVHDQLIDLAAATQTTLDAIPVIPFPEEGWAANQVQRNGLQRAIDSMLHYAKHLELPTGFQACTGGLVNPQSDPPHAYNLPDPPDPGAGSLRNLVISGFDCVDLNCEVPQEDPTTGGGGGSFCIENPNWSKDNAAPSISGAGVPEQGTVTLTFCDTDAEPQFAGVAVAYERLANCPADAICPFALTDLRFTLQDVTFGFLTLQAPSISLARIAFGTQVGEDVKIGAGELVLRIESSILFAGQPFLQGIMIPMVVVNKGTAAIRVRCEHRRRQQAAGPRALAGTASMSRQFRHPTRRDRSASISSRCTRTGRGTSGSGRSPTASAATMVIPSCASPNGRDSAGDRYGGSWRMTPGASGSPPTVASIATTARRS